MRRIHCLSCGKVYDYDTEGCCPSCGAYNRPPRRKTAEGDEGAIHILQERKFSTIPQRRRDAGQKVCYERKECFEQKIKPLKVQMKGELPSLIKEKVGKFAAPLFSKGNRRDPTVSAVFIIAIAVIGAFIIYSMNAPEDRPYNYGSNTSEVEAVQTDSEQNWVNMGEIFLWWDGETAVLGAHIDSDNQAANTTRIYVDVKTGEEYDQPYLYRGGDDEIYYPDRSNPITEGYQYIFEIPEKGLKAEDLTGFAVEFEGDNGGTWVKTDCPLE